MNEQAKIWIAGIDETPGLFDIQDFRALAIDTAERFNFAPLTIVRNYIFFEGMPPVANCRPSDRAAGGCCCGRWAQMT